VEVNVNSNLLGMVARLVEKSEAEAATLLRGLQLVRVSVVSLTKENQAELTERVQAIRSQLDGNGWDKIVGARQKTEDIGIYLKTKGGEAVEGLVITVLAKKEVVLVNIVGHIRPEQVATLGERLNIDPLKKLGESMPRR
jgi:hypothetical protein